MKQMEHTATDTGPGAIMLFIFSVVFNFVTVEGVDHFVVMLLHVIQAGAAAAAMVLAWQKIKKDRINKLP
jgi:hypothetical protein